MKPILLLIVLHFAFATVACDEQSGEGTKNQSVKNTQFAFTNAIPIPQKHTLEVVIDSRAIGHLDAYEFDLRDLKKVEASSLIKSRNSLQDRKMGHDPKVHGLTHTEIFDVGPLYQADGLKAGLFFGLKARNDPNLHLQTALPLAYGDFAVWGFADEQRHLWYMQNLREYLKSCSESIWVADFTYSRLQESYYWTIGEMNHLKSLSLPLHGVDFDSQELALPNSLERLVVYNTKVDEKFGEKIKHLRSLKELIFVGCWLDTHSSQPHWGNDHFDGLNLPIRSKLDPPVHPFNHIHQNLLTLKFIDCDKKLLISTDYYTWPNLNQLEIVSSFEYPSEDGVWAFDFLKFEPNDSPHIHKDYFHSLSKLIIRNPSLGRALSDHQIEEIQKHLKVPKSSFSLPENEDISNWTHADAVALSLKRRFDRNKFDFKYSITHLR